MNTIPQAFENNFNRINDWDGTWLGLRRLKPAQSEQMSVRTVLILSSVYAPIVAGVVALMFFIPRVPGEIVWLASLLSAMTFVVLQSLSARFWNRRAARLQAGSRHPAA